MLMSKISHLLEHKKLAGIACAFLDVWDMVIDTIFQVFQLSAAAT